MVLEGLSDDEEWILELTARCGRRFSVDELASGLRIDRLPLLRQLEVIDRQWDLLEDLDEENHFFAARRHRRSSSSGPAPNDWRRGGTRPST